MTYPINGYGDYYWMSDDEYEKFEEHVDELIDFHEKTGITLPLHTNLPKFKADLEKARINAQSDVSTDTT